VARQTPPAARPNKRTAHARGAPPPPREIARRDDPRLVVGFRAGACRSASPVALAAPAPLPGRRAALDWVARRAGVVTMNNLESGVGCRNGGWNEKPMRIGKSPPAQPEGETSSESERGIAGCARDYKDRRKSEVVLSWQIRRMREPAETEYSSTAQPAMQGSVEARGVSQAQPEVETQGRKSRRFETGKAGCGTADASRKFAAGLAKAATAGESR
jgi:hypothetical protein